MQISLKRKNGSTKNVVMLSIYTLLFALGCMVFGYLLLPIAAAFFALLVLCENPNKRIFSYLVPVITVTANIFVSGLYSLEGIAYAAVGLIIFAAFRRGLSKGETAFWISLAVFVLMLLSLILVFVNAKEALDIGSLKEYCANLYSTVKTQFVEAVTSVKLQVDEEVSFFAYNAYVAEALFDELLIYSVAVFSLISFFIAGITLKLFVKIANSYSSEETRISDWSFRTSNAVAYFYIIVSVIAYFEAAGASVFSYVVITLNTIFSAVFLYIGVKTVFHFIVSRGKSKFFAALLIIIASGLVSSFAAQLLSYIGVFANMRQNKAAKISGN